MSHSKELDPAGDENGRPGSGGPPARVAERFRVAWSRIRTAVAGSPAAEASRHRSPRQPSAQEITEAKAQESLKVAATELLNSNSLLLNEQEQRLAAQVSEEHPYRVASVRDTSQRSDLQRGFTWTIGGLLAIWLGLSLHAIQHELILLLVAAFIAIGLDPAVRWLVRHQLSRSPVCQGELRPAARSKSASTGRDSG